MAGGSLKKLRRRIDRLDRRMVRLLVHRYRAVRRIGMLKKLGGLPVIDRERESSILQNIGGRVVDPGACSFITSVYRTLFRASRMAEENESMDKPGDRG